MRPQHGPKKKRKITSKEKSERERGNFSASLLCMVSHSVCEEIFSNPFNLNFLKLFFSASGPCQRGKIGKSRSRKKPGMHYMGMHSFPFIFVNGVSTSLDKACNAAGANAGAETGRISIFNNLERGRGGGTSKTAAKSRKAASVKTAACNSEEMTHKQADKC